MGVFSNGGEVMRLRVFSNQGGGDEAWSFLKPGVEAMRLGEVAKVVVHRVPGGPAALGPCQNHWITGRTGHSQAGLLLRTLALLHGLVAIGLCPSSYAKRTRGLVAMTSA